MKHHLQALACVALGLALGVVCGAVEMAHRAHLTPGEQIAAAILDVLSH